MVKQLYLYYNTQHQLQLIVNSNNSLALFLLLLDPHTQFNRRQILSLYLMMVLKYLPLLKI